MCYVKLYEIVGPTFLLLYPLSLAGLTFFFLELTCCNQASGRILLKYIRLISPSIGLMGTFVGICGAFRYLHGDITNNFPLFFACIIEAFSSTIFGMVSWLVSCTGLYLNLFMRVKRRQDVS
jgi:hypothetical protein